MNQNQPLTEPVNPQIDLKQTVPVECNVCKNQSFTEAFLLRRVSAILSQTGKAGLLPISGFACVSCGHINEEFLPIDLRKNVIKTPIIKSISFDN